MGRLGAGRPFIFAASQSSADLQAVFVTSVIALRKGFHREAFVQELIYSIGVIVVSIVIVALF